MQAVSMLVNWSWCLWCIYAFSVGPADLLWLLSCWWLASCCTRHSRSLAQLSAKQKRGRVRIRRIQTAAAAAAEMEWTRGRTSGLSGHGIAQHWDKPTQNLLYFKSCVSSVLLWENLDFIWWKHATTLHSVYLRPRELENIMLCAAWLNGIVQYRWSTCIPLRWINTEIT